jgi:hypothetical protein
MHPEIARQVVAEHIAELHQLARRQGLAAQYREAGRHSAAPSLLARVRRLATAVRRGRADGAAGRDAALSGVFTAGAEAFGVRAYLTADEARQLAADWAGLLARFGDRAEDPSRRPDDAVLFEVVVLGRQVPDLAGATRGCREADMRALRHHAARE